MTDTFTPPAPLLTAVLFLVFNRPDTTAQVFEAIRKAKPPRLYVAADGPREGREGEAEKVAKVREIATAVDWPCEVKTLFREENLGCKYSVSGGISWFFEHEEQGIILEDDCLPSQSFFWFCEELLKKYAEDGRVFHIDACNFTGQSVAFGADYDFSSYALIWGWASWRRAWEHYNVELNKIDILKARSVLSSRFGTKKAVNYWMRNFEQLKNGLDTWDYQWFACIWLNGGVTIRPKINMVKNIGFGEDATHTTMGSTLFEKMRAEECLFPLKHVPFVRANFNRDLLCSRIRFGIGKGLFRRVLSRLLRIASV